MTLSPQDRAAVLELAAEKIKNEVCACLDMAELITLPLSVVSQITGLGAKQVQRVFATRAMGSRKLGVSLKAVQLYQKQP